MVGRSCGNIDKLTNPISIFSCSTKPNAMGQRFRVSTNTIHTKRRAFHNPEEQVRGTSGQPQAAAAEVHLPYHSEYSSWNEIWPPTNPGPWHRQRGRIKSRRVQTPASKHKHASVANHRARTMDATMQQAPYAHGKEYAPV